MPVDDEDTTTVTAPAVEALQQLRRHGRQLCPAGADSDAWAGQVLDDLARLSELLDGAVAQVSGRRNDTVSDQTRALASVISAHRNLAVGDRSA